MEIGQILQVQKFNQQAEARWRQRVDEWKERHIAGEGIPQLAFYVFTDSKGQYKKRGYVIKTSADGYKCRPTKRECEKIKAELHA